MNKKRFLAIMVTAVVTALVLASSCATSTNRQPIITSLDAEPERTTPSGSLQVTCSASDPDGDQLGYIWSASAGAISGSGNTVAWAAPPSEGSYSVAVTVTDGRGGEVTDYVTVAVRANEPPAISSLIADADWVTPSGSLQVTCNATDPDGDELSYEWSASGGEINGAGASATWTAPDSAGSYNVAVTVTDVHGGEATKQIAITVGANRAPYISSLVADPDWVTPSGSLQVTCNATDPDGDEVSYEWSASGGSIAGTDAVVNWIAPKEIGMYNITVIVDDGRGGNATRTIDLRASNGPSPVIESVIVTAKGHPYLKETATGYMVLRTYAYDIECLVSGTNGGLVYEWSSNGGEISGEGSIVTWRAPGTAGDVTLTVVVTDVADDSASKSIILNVVTCPACILG